MPFAKCFIYISIVSQSMWMKILHKQPENAFDNSNLDSGCHQGDSPWKAAANNCHSTALTIRESGHFRLAHHIVSFFGT